MISIVPVNILHKKIYCILDVFPLSVKDVNSLLYKGIFTPCLCFNPLLRYYKQWQKAVFANQILNIIKLQSSGLNNKERTNRVV